MGRVQNVFFATLAVSVLVLGVLALVPQPAQAIFVHSSSASLTGTGDPLVLTVTTTVRIPAGQFVPLSYGELRVLPGTVAALNGQGFLVGPACVASSVVVTGAAASNGAYTGDGYSLVSNADGYGYDFGSSYDVFDGYGYGSGYGSPSTETVVTVTLTASGCITVAQFGGQAAAWFVVQTSVGGSPIAIVPGLPQAVLLRNPAFDFGTEPSDKPISFTPSHQGGPQNSFRYGLLVGTLNDDGYLAPGGSTIYPLPVIPGSSIKSLGVRLNTELPEGISIDIDIIDGTTGGPVSLGNPPFSIQADVLSGQTGTVVPFGFMRVRVTGLPAGMDASDAIDLFVTFDLPQSYFTGTPGLNPNTFRLVPFTDAGALKPASIPQPTCSKQPTVGTTVFTFDCTITHFSAFAMVARAYSSGGGGGGGGGSNQNPSQPSGPTDPTVPTPPVDPSTGDPTVSPAGQGTERRVDFVPLLSAAALVALAALIGLFILLWRRRGKSDE